MVAAIFYQVVARYFFNSPPAWTEEISRYLQVWLVCLMAGPLIYSAEHLEIDVVFNIMSKKAQRRCDLVRHTISLIFSIVILYYGVLLNILKKPQASPALEISMAWIYWVVPIMAILIAINQITAIISVFKGKASKNE